MSEAEQDAERHLITLAMQYYIAGRSAAVHQMVPVTGNLLHHAIEMLLKALLVSGLGLKGIAKLRHNLVDIWVAAVAKHPNLESPDRGRAIEELHRFETLRYPDSMIQSGAAIRFGWGKSSPMPSMTVPTYDLVIEDVDEIFSGIFRATGKNAKFFLAMLNKKALATLHDRNAYPIG